MTKIRFVQHDGGDQLVDADDGVSVMQSAHSAGVAGIVGECGGCMACATCHVYVSEDWLPRLDPPSEDETAMLEGAVDPRSNSRLSCQIVVTPKLDGLTVHVPENQF